MKMLLTTLMMLVASQAVYAETVSFWDGDAVVTANGKYHGGLNFTQESVYVEYVSGKDGTLGGSNELHINNIDGQMCELMHTPEEGLLIVPELGPRAKLTSLKYRFKDRYRETGAGAGAGATVKLYVWVGNKDALQPTSMPGEAGWLTYELKRNRKFDTIDFQAQSNPPPRGSRYYITSDDQGSVYIDDIEVGK